MSVLESHGKLKFRLIDQLMQMTRHGRYKITKRVDERRSPSQSRTWEILSKLEGVTGGALRRVCKALRAIPGKVRERVKSFVKG